MARKVICRMGIIILHDKHGVVQNPAPISKQNRNTHLGVSVLCGDDVRNFEPRTRLSFAIIDKSIKELRAMYKIHPEWFETPHPESNRGKNEVDYSIK